MRLDTIFQNRKWWIIFLSIYDVFVFLPFIAPVFMHWNMGGVGRAIYMIYSFLCHQLPERSLFFFGKKWMYLLDEIKIVWQNTDNPLILRQFIGTPEMGWKVAWSDRMISKYAGIWLAGLIWGLLPKHAGKISIWILLLLALPLALDGGTPSIAVDQQKIDYGDVKFGVNKTFAIKVTNTGDGTLRFKEKPYIQLLQGC